MTNESVDGLTAVIVVYRKNRANHRLIFGEPVFKVRRGWRREFAVFHAGQTFAYERWRANEFGTQDWRLFVCETCKTGPITKIPGVQPGARLLLNVQGKARVKRTLERIDQLKKTHQSLAQVTPRAWREMHNDIQVGGIIGTSI